MREIILISHGGMAEGVKSSLEMITGAQEHVHALSMGVDSDNIQFEETLSRFVNSIDDEILIIADILGGTPCNVAVKLYMDEDRVAIFAGMSLPLVIEATLNATGSLDDLLSSARQGITNVKATVDAIQNTDKKEAVDDISKYKEYEGKAVIVNTRIDERLVHGQVASIWSSSLNTQRIIVANDEAAADPLQKSSLRMAAPTSMRLSVIPVAEAAQNINSGKYGNQRIFLLFKNPNDVLRFLEAGGKVETLTVGNMSYKEGAKEITKNIKVLPNEEGIFDQIADHGVNIVAQLVPNDPEVDFMKKLKN